MTDESEQIEICLKYGSEFIPPLPFEKAGVARDISSGLIPINGLRHLPVSGTSGWYLWAGGEPNQDDGYFEPVHMIHLNELCPVLIKFLGLAPGWRFLVAPDYEDVWFDPSILVE